MLVEPHLQQVTGETLQSSSLTENEVRLDICTRRFWQTGQMAFFDIIVFKPNAKRFVNTDISKIYELTKKKKRLYNVPITEIEYGSFTPLMMPATGGMG